MEISKQLAAQIVQAVYDVVKNDINFINASGIIIGSTNQNRIGTFHEAGYQAIITKTPISVNDSHTFKGAQSGLNYPIFLESTPIAAIGITGDPTQLKQFGFLITKITEVFLKEQQLNEELLSETRSLHYLVTALIYDNTQNQQQLEKLFTKYNIDTSAEYSVLSIKILDTALEPKLRFYFTNIGCQLSVYLYPNEWVVLFDAKSFSYFSTEAFQKQFEGQLHAGLGSFGSVHQICQSYQSALTARTHAHRQHLTFCNSEDISIEYILESLPENIQHTYAEHMLTTLNEKDLQLLKLYFSCNLSLADTATSLYIHKNTLQYQLNRITEKSGLNPRIFQDAFLLQFALLCKH